MRAPTLLISLVRKIYKRQAVRAFVVEFEFLQIGHLTRKEIMAKSGGSRCTCLNPACQYLTDNTINKDFTKQLSDLKKKAKRSTGPKPESIMYTGGTIRPLKCGKVDEVVNTIGFHQGKVVAAGTATEVTARMDSLNMDYTKVNLPEGQTLLPGFIEPHMHIVSTAMMLEAWNDFGPFDGQYLQKEYDPTWLKDKIASAKESISRNFWILGHSVDPSLMPFKVIDDDLNELQDFNIDTVDGLENSVPLLMLSATGYVNTKALKLVYDLNQQGYPTFEEYRDHINSGGGLQEMEEIFPAFAAIPKLQIFATALSLIKGLRSMFELANERGMTMLYDAAMSSGQKDILDAYFFLNNSNIRIGYAQLCDSVEGAKKLPPYKPTRVISKWFQMAQTRG